MLAALFHNKPKLAVHIWAFTINTLLLYFLLLLFWGIQDIDNTWQKNAKASIYNTSLLAKIERNIGYIGFIHHFKNYILRGSDQYYDKAVKSHQQTVLLLAELKISTDSEADQKDINIISQTLDSYHQKLIFAHKNKEIFSIKDLDNQVKVDDSNASNALNSLRERLKNRLNNKIRTTDKAVAHQKNMSILAALLLCPIFLVSNFFTIRFINKLAETKDELNNIFDMSPDGIMFIDKNGAIIRSNQAASKIFEYTQNEFNSLSIEDLLNTNDRKKHKIHRENFTKHEDSRNMRNLGSEITGKTKNDRTVKLGVAISTKKINDEVRSVCIIRDETEKNSLKDKAEHDHLTSIYNRRSIEEIINKEIYRSARNGKTFSLLLIDIDNFKNINDSLGHQEGDKTIIEVADYLKGEIRSYDTLARWGGDEFIILCPELNKDESTKFAERLRKGLEKNTTNEASKITLSIGITTSDINSPQSYNHIIKCADIALYKVKENGRNSVHHHTEANLLGTLPTV